MGRGTRPYGYHLWQNRHDGFYTISAYIACMIVRQTMVCQATNHSLEKMKVFWATPEYLLRQGGTALDAASINAECVSPGI
jgi:hypothetical protein